MNQQMDARPLAAGNVLHKVAGKAVAIEYKLQWKEAVGPIQYGVATSGGLDTVDLLTEDMLKKYSDFCAMSIDGRNAFISVDRQKFLDLVFQKFPELSLFIETWYVGTSELLFFMEDQLWSLLALRAANKATQLLSLFFPLQRALS